MYERILAPVDFSRLSVLRLHRAKILAESCGASVDVLHVWKPPPPSLDRNPLSYHNMVQHEVLCYLDTLLEMVGAQWFNKIAVAGKPAEVIETYSCRYDLLIIGPNRRGLTHLGLGNTAKLVVQKSRCSVLVVPPGRLYVKSSDSRRIAAPNVDHLSEKPS